MSIFTTLLLSDAVSKKNKKLHPIGPAYPHGKKPVNPDLHDDGIPGVVNGMRQKGGSGSGRKPRGGRFHIPPPPMPGKKKRKGGPGGIPLSYGR